MFILVWSLSLRLSFASKGLCIVLCTVLFLSFSILFLTYETDFRDRAESQHWQEGEDTHSREHTCTCTHRGSSPSMPDRPLTTDRGCQNRQRPGRADEGMGTAVAVAHAQPVSASGECSPIVFQTRNRESWVNCYGQKC